MFKLKRICLLAVMSTAVNAAPVQFEDTSDKLGFSRGTESWGIAWGNLNGDKWPDLWNQGHRDFPRLYRNIGNGDFDDVTLEYDGAMGNWWLNDTQRDHHGGAWGDYDNDGDDDLLLGDEDEFFINRADVGGYFTQTTTLTPRSFAAWQDLDGDNRLDVERTCGIQEAAATEQNVQLVDLNNDGSLDQLCFGVAEFPGSLINFNGSDSALNNRIDPISLVSDAISGDFNNDLLVDFIVLRGMLRPSGASKVSDRGIDAYFRDNGGFGFTFAAAGNVTFMFDGGGGGAFREADVRVLNANGTRSTSARDVDVTYEASTARWRVEYSSNNFYSQAYVRIRADNPVTEPAVFGRENSELPQPVYHAVNTGGAFDWRFNVGAADPVKCVSVVAEDFDNDMDQDLYFACGGGVENTANLYYDNRGDGTFELVAIHGAEGPVGAGLETGVAESVAAADYDVDGFMDLAVVNGLNFYPFSLGGPDALYRNRGNANHWVQLDLIGVNSTRPGLGAKVYVTAGGVTQLRVQDGGYHRYSQDHQRIHFGLAGNTVIDELRIEWPSGQTDTYTGVSVDRLYDATEGQGLTVPDLGPEVPTVIADGEECGAPPYTLTYGPAMLIWRECGTDSWQIRMRSGLGRLTEGVPQVSVGSIEADSAFSGVNSANLTAIDTLDASTTGQIDFSVSVQDDTGGDKSIRFNTAGQSYSCLSMDSTDIEAVIIGSKGKRVDLPFDFVRRGACNLDTDGDGLNNDVDPDDDNDGVPDVNDAFPLDPTESLDTDGDGRGNNSDTDDDGDGVLDSEDFAPLDPNEQFDTDGDGIGNNTDSDDDGDGVADVNDAFPLDPGETADSDGDGVGDNADQFPNDPNETTDSDGDGVGDNGDIDADNDGMPDATENTAGGTIRQLVDDFETNRGWVTNPNGSDTATTGQWEVADPQPTSSSGITMQPGNAFGGIQALVTQAAAGTSEGSFDIDSGVTSARSPAINLSANVSTLSLHYYFGHLSNANNDDFLRITLQAGAAQQVLLNERGVASNRGASWTALNVDVSAYAGQSIRLLVEAADAGTGSLIEAGIDQIEVSVSLDDVDGDGIAQRFDLDSDNDAVPDVVEAGLTDADGNFIVDNLVNDQGSVTNPPDSDGDGIPDFLDVESNNASNNGTAYDIAGTAFAALDTNNDGQITAADANGGVDADGDGIDDAVDGDPTGPGGGTPTDSDGDGVPDSRDAYPNDPSRSLPEVSVASLAVSEGAGDVTVQVNLSVAAVVSGQVNLRTQDNTALAGSDYVALNTTLNFAAGDTSKAVVIGLLNDTQFEAAEQFTLVLDGQVNLILGNSTASVNIADDDTPSGISPCGEPVIDAANEAGVFVWKDCASGIWEMRVSGGGSPSALTYAGLVEAPDGLISFEPFSLETGDVLDNSLDATRLNYSLAVAGGGRDGFSFVPVQEPGSCFYATPPSGAQVYVGSERAVVEAPFDLDTLEACGNEPPPIDAACGEPVFDRQTEAGLFLWKDCISGEWTARVSGGGAEVATYNGAVEAAAGFSATRSESLETNDLFDDSATDALTYSMTVGNAGLDSISFVPNADACFSVALPRSDLAVYLGSERMLVDTPLDLTTLGTCQSEPPIPVCGQPVYDRATEQAIFLWKDCALGRWELRATGGGALDAFSYTGEVNSSGGFVSFEGFSLETNDVLDNAGDPDLLSYILYVAGPGQDGFNFVPRNDTCVHLVSPEVSVFVGPDRLELVDGSVNLDTLEACP